MSMRINITNKTYPVAQKVAKSNSFKMVTNSHPILLENIDTKINLILNSGSKNALLEMEPKIFQSANNIRDSILRAIGQFKEKYNLSYDDITAFIMGGRDNKHRYQGNTLANCVADTLEDADVPFSMLCGKRPLVEMDNIYTINKNTTLWNGSFKDIHKKVTEEEAINELKHMYEIVELSDDVPFNFEVPRWFNS